MGHEVHEYVTLEAPRNFEAYWRQTPHAYRDGCTSVKVRRTDYATGKATKTRTNAFIKKAQKNVKSVYNDLNSVPSYTCVAYDVGITGYLILQKKNKIVNHKRQEVTLSKRYASKPTHIPTGGKLLELHQYVASYDFRCYDPEEHGGFSAYEMADRDVDLFRC